MAEPATTAPSTVAELDRAALLATRLHVPCPRAGLVPRPRLLERLAEGMGRDVILVCTPAGFGKTTLLAEWARTGHRPVAWLSLDPGDNDPAGSGATPPPPWTRSNPGWPSGSPGCSVACRRRSRRWWPRWSTSWPPRRSC
jgi:hypothetical protein